MSAIETIVGDRNNRDNALKSLYNDIHTKHMFPFWATSTDVAHDEIKQLMGSSKANPFLWSYDRDIEPILNRAAELVTMDDSERRSLVLVNPGLAPQRATAARRIRPTVSTTPSRSCRRTVIRRMPSASD